MQRCKLGDALRIFLRHCPGHRAAPIVPDDGCFSRVERFDEIDHIFHQNFYTIVFYLRWLVAQVVAPHVRCDDMILFPQCGQLMAPRIPELWKTMEQDHKVAVDTVRFSIVQTNPVDAGKVLLDSGL